MTAPDRPDASNRTGPRPVYAFAAVLLAAAMLVALPGCSSGGGRMTVSSVLEPDLSLLGRFDHGIYSYHDANTLRIVLVEGELENPRQVVHLQMHWQPKAGSTPTDRTSTNTTVRYVVFSGDAVGVYSGAGFLFPQNSPGGAEFRGQLRHTSVRLADASEEFVDRLGLSEVSGSFKVRRDDAATLRMTRLVERRLREQLGYPALVDGSADEIAAPLARFSTHRR